MCALLKGNAHRAVHAVFLLLWDLKAKAQKAV